MLNPIKMAFSTIKAVVKRKLNEQMTDIFDLQAAASAAAAAANLTLTAYRKNILKRIVWECAIGRRNNNS